MIYYFDNTDYFRAQWVVDENMGEKRFVKLGRYVINPNLITSSDIDNSGGSTVKLMAHRNGHTDGPANASGNVDSSGL